MGFFSATWGSLKVDSQFSPFTFPKDQPQCYRQIGSDAYLRDKVQT